MQAARETLIVFSFLFFSGCSQMRSEVKLVLGGKKQLHSYSLFLLTFAKEPDNSLFSSSLQIQYRRGLEEIMCLWNPWGRKEWTGRWSDRYGFWKPSWRLFTESPVLKEPCPLGQCLTCPLQTLLQACGCRYTSCSHDAILQVSIRHLLCTL
jgi:hypothetical protein